MIYMYVALISQLIWLPIRINTKVNSLENGSIFTILVLEIKKTRSRQSIN